MEEAPTHLDLFSGIGGFALAAKWAGFKTIGFCEIDKYCQKVLAKNFMGYPAKCEDWRIQQSQLPANTGAGSPIFSNIFDFDGSVYRGVDLITGGFPCQPFSVAGKRRGAADDRAIWPQMFRVISEARPAFVLGENVAGLIPMELDNVLSDLEGIGYATRAFVIPACAVDARHRRDRVWIIGRFAGNTESERMEGNGTDRKQESHAHAQSGLSVRPDGAMADTAAQGLPQPGLEPRESATDAGFGTEHCCRWLPEPDVGRVVDELSDWLDGPYCTFPPEPNIPRVAHGIKNRVDRLKGLGNSILPRVAYEILRAIRHEISIHSVEEKRSKD